MTRTDDHNAQHLLVIRQLPACQGPGLGPGWYVVRVCACHHGQRVSLPYPTAERAARARQVILGELTTPSEPRLQWYRDAETDTVTCSTEGGDDR